VRKADGEREMENLKSFFYFCFSFSHPLTHSAVVKCEPTQKIELLLVVVTRDEGECIFMKKKLINIKTINKRFCYTLFGIGDDFIYFFN
jgi:hypothetical protein